MELSVFSEKHRQPSGILLVLLETYTVSCFIFFNNNPYLRSFQVYNFLILSLCIPESVTAFILMTLPKPDVVEEMIILSIQEIGIDIITMLENHVFNLLEVQETLPSDIMKNVYQKEINLAVGDIKIWEFYLGIG